MLGGGAPARKNYNFFGFWRHRHHEEPDVFEAGQERPGTIVINAARQRKPLPGGRRRLRTPVRRAGRRPYRLHLKGAHRITAKKQSAGLDPAHPGDAGAAWPPGPYGRRHQNRLALRKAMDLWQHALPHPRLERPETIGQAVSSGCSA